MKTIAPEEKKIKIRQLYEDLDVDQYVSDTRTYYLMYTPSKEWSAICICFSLLFKNFPDFDEFSKLFSSSGWARN